MSIGLDKRLESKTDIFDTKAGDILAIVIWVLANVLSFK